MSDRPLVSILMNCYNGQRYLKEALDSVINQTYKNWELIFWNNQSQDESVKIFNTYHDKRFKLFNSEKHTVLHEGRNLAIQKTSGELIAFLDTDDIWLPDKLSKQVELFRDETIGMVYGNCWILNNNLFFKKKKIYYRKKMPTGKVLKSILSDYVVGFSTIIIRKKKIKNIKRVFNTKYDLLADFDFVVNFSINNNIQCIQEPVAYLRVHEESLSHTLSDQLILQLKEWYFFAQSHSILSSQEELREVYEKILFMEAKQIISKQEFFKGFYQFLRYPFGAKKIKLFLLLILPKKVLLLLKKINYF